MELLPDVGVMIRVKRWAIGCKGKRLCAGMHLSAGLRWWVGVSWKRQLYLSTMRCICMRRWKSLRGGRGCRPLQFSALSSRLPYPLYGGNVLAC